VRSSGRITWLGHATVLIDLGGVRVLTDPLLRRRVAHLRRHAPLPAAPGKLDAVLLSHMHRDHVDRRSLRLVAADVPVLSPVGTGPDLRRMGRLEVVELRAGDRVSTGAGHVLAVHAEHDGRRSPLRPRAPALGFVVEHAGLRVYFAGDTGHFDGLAELGPLDVALVPIWGWGPTLGPGHLDPVGAAEMVALLRPRVVVPIHWGTYLPLGFGREHALLREPARAFATAVHESSPAVDLALLQPTQSLELGA
jgi:L-ascorbate metabolism protein UlaG (beta-lactamase superfamily)